MMPVGSGRPRNEEARRETRRASVWRLLLEAVELPVQAGAGHAELGVGAGGERVSRDRAATADIAGRGAVAAEIDVEILALQGDVVGQRVFDAAADRVADLRG